MDSSSFTEKLIPFWKAAESSELEAFVRQNPLQNKSKRFHGSSQKHIIWPIFEEQCEINPKIKNIAYLFCL